MKANHIHNHETSQRQLAAGVLKQAKQDLRRFHDAASPIERELYLDVYRWVMSDDSTWPFSFLNVCQSLNLVPEDVRQDLIDQLSQGTFRRWINHCRRTIQKLAMFLASVSPSRRTMTAAEPTISVQTLH
jgi:hypothetical protein